MRVFRAIEKIDKCPKRKKGCSPDTIRKHLCRDETPLKEKLLKELKDRVK